MKNRPSREIEIFSLSAIDLFAAAMGAFALLTVVLMPYYQNEVRERTPDNAISDLARAAENSVEETVEQRKALEEKRSAAARNVSAIKSDADKLLAELRGAEAALLEKRAEAEQAVDVPEPIDRQPAPQDGASVVSFRFLGMKTDKNDITLALDMNRCMGGHEASINNAVERIVSSLQDYHRLNVVGFQQTDAGPRLHRWPSSGEPRTVSGSVPGDAIGFAEGLTSRFGGSASMLSAFETMLRGPGQAIFLVSDGLPNPRANNGLRPAQLAREITNLNAGRKEIHTVVVGNYFDYDGTVEFMEQLAGRNGGQFMALASPTSGVCD
ncbi:MAG: vWA domain-containing protein [Pseudomonadota bacterium]